MKTVSDSVSDFSQDILTWPSEPCSITPLQGMGLDDDSDKASAPGFVARRLHNKATCNSLSQVAFFHGLTAIIPAVSTSFSGATNAQFLIFRRFCF